MRKIKIYLDTSVISHLLQEDVPEKMDDIIKFWEQIMNREDTEVILSVVTMQEISECAEPKLSYLLTKIAELKPTLVEETEEDLQISRLYLENGVLKEKSMDDLRHIAIAVNNNCKYIVSWNFKHFVNPKTMNAVAAINKLNNLNDVTIVSPSMMLGGF